MIRVQSNLLGIAGAEEDSYHNANISCSKSSRSRLQFTSKSSFPGRMRGPTVSPSNISPPPPNALQVALICHQIEPSSPSSSLLYAAVVIVVVQVRPWFLSGVDIGRRRRCFLVPFVVVKSTRGRSLSTTSRRDPFFLSGPSKIPR